MNKTRRRNSQARESVLLEMKRKGWRRYTILVSDVHRPSGDFAFIPYIQRIDVGRVLVLTIDPATERSMLQME